MTYHEGADGILYPDLKLGDYEKKTLGKYGQMRKSYLKTHRKALYQAMILKDTLWPHLMEIDEAAQNRIDAIVEAMAKQDGTDERLKAQDPLRWVGLMNSYRNSAEEIVLNDLIYT